MLRPAVLQRIRQADLDRRKAEVKLEDVGGLDKIVQQLVGALSGRQVTPETARLCLKVFGAYVGSHLAIRVYAHITPKKPNG